MLCDKKQIPNPLLYMIHIECLESLRQLLINLVYTRAGGKHKTARYGTASSVGDGVRIYLLGIKAEIS